MKAAFSVLFAIFALPLWAEQGKVSRDVFGGNGRLEVIDTASKVEACILSVEDPSRGRDLNQRTFVEGRYVALSEHICTLVTWKLLDDRNYTWDKDSGCIPTYNARVRFTSGERTVEVDFCFSCSQIIVRENGSPVGGGYFYPGSDWVFQAIATQFPRDTVIRKLKKQREAAEVYRLEVEFATARDARKGKANHSPEPAPGAVH